MLGVVEEDVALQLDRGQAVSQKYGNMPVNSINDWGRSSSVKHHGCDLHGLLIATSGLVVGGAREDDTFSPRLHRRLACRLVLELPPLWVGLIEPNYLGVVT